MRMTGVEMVSLDRDHTFLGQHLLQRGIRFGYLTVILSIVPGARVVKCVTGEEGEIAPSLILFHPMTLEKSFRLPNRLILHHMA